MAYLIHLWDAPSPCSLADAEAILSRLLAQGAVPPKADYVDCMAHLDALFPVEADDVWIETPDPGHAALTLGIVSGELARVLPAVHAVARSRGLVFYDGQAGEVMLPSGIGYGPTWSFIAPATPLEPSPDEPPTPNTTARRLRQLIRPSMARHDYREGSGEDWFRKSTPAARLLLRGSIVRGRLKFSMLVEPRFAPAWKALAQRCENSPLRLDLARFAAQQALQFPAALEQGLLRLSYQIDLLDWPEIDAFGATIQRLLDSGVLEFLDGLISIAILDEQANRVPDDRCPFLNLRGRTAENGLLVNYHVDLAVARAAANPAFDAMARQRVAQYEQGSADSRRMVPSLLKLLAEAGWTSEEDQQ
jgi:hypothetical protein